MSAAVSRVNGLVRSGFTHEDSLKGSADNSHPGSQALLPRFVASQLGALAQAQRAQALNSVGAIVSDPEPLFDVSPHLHMKFMEVLGVAVKSAPPSLDSAASRSRRTIFLHVTNMSFSGAVEVSFVVEGVVAPGGRVPEISPENPRHEISPGGS